MSVDFMNSLASGVNDLMRTMKEVQSGMQALQQESRDQRGQIATILGEMQAMKITVETNNDNYRKDMDKLNKEINDKIAKLQAKAPPPAAVAPPSVGAAPSPATGSPASVGPTPGGGGFRPTRIWLKGFKETLTTKYLVNYANTVIAKLPAPLKATARAGAPGFGAVVYVDFPAGTDMAKVKKAINEMNLEHEDENKTKHKIRTAPDVPLAFRHRGRVLGELWKLLQPHLDAQDDCEGYKLGNSNGRLFLIAGDRPSELFSSTMEGKDLHVTPNEKNLAKVKVTMAQAAAWIEAASRTAVRDSK
jgi:hypothetical protein